MTTTASLNAWKQEPVSPFLADCILKDLKAMEEKLAGIRYTLLCKYVEDPFTRGDIAHRLASVQCQLTEAVRNMDEQMENVMGE